MQKTKKGILVGNPLMLGWIILCISVFIFFPGRVSFIQWSNFADWRSFPEHLARLDIFTFVGNLFFAFLGITLFSSSCTSFGIFIANTINVANTPNQLTLLSVLSLISTFFLLGHTAYSVIFLTLSSLYKLTPLLVSIILFFGFILGLIQFKNIAPNLFVKWGQVGSQEDKIYKTVFQLSMAILFLALLQSSARISYDASAIYFSDAKLTAIERNIRFFTNDTFVVSVFHTAIQYTALIQLFGDQAARMFSWVFGLIIVIFSLALGERIGLSKQANTILLALLLTSTSFVDLMGDGKVDLVSSAPAIAAIYWMVHRQDQPSNKSYLFLVGFLIGLAIIARPFNAFLLGLFCTLYYFQTTILSKGFNATSFNAFLTSMLWIAAGAVGLGIYHLFANWVILGSPFAFLTSVSSINPISGPWDAKPSQILTLRLLYPFIATFRNNPQSLGNMSPLAIAFVPALLLFNVRRNIKLSKELLSLTMISVIVIILWIGMFFTVVELRYVLFLWIILFLPTAEIITIVLGTGDRIFQMFMRGMIIFLLIFFTSRTIYISINSYSPVDKQGNPVCHEYSFCEYLKPINQNASLGDRVLTLGAYRYYLRTDLFACSTTPEEYSILQELSYKNSELFWAEVYRNGYKFIAYENDYTTRHLQFGLLPDLRTVPSWMELEPIFGKLGDLVVAYQIHYLNPPKISQIYCHKTMQGIWQLDIVEQ